MDGATRLKRYIAQQERQERMRITAIDALLMRRFWRYALQRLWPFMATRGLSFALRVVELTLLAETFGQRIATGIFGLHVACDFVASGWWSALEAMRSRIRDTADDAAARRTLQTWTSLGVTLGLAVAALAGLAFTALALSGHGSAGGGAVSLGVVDSSRIGSGSIGSSSFASGSIAQGRIVLAAFVALRLLGLALELPLRAAHSGLYAFSRVYRPLWSVWITDAVFIPAVLLTSPWLGEGAFVFGAVVQLGLSRALAWLFILRGYAFHRWQVPSLRPRLRLPGDLRLAGVAFAAGAFARSVEVVALVWAVRRSFVGTADELAPMAWYFALCFPLLRAAAGFGQLFYPDLVRLRPYEAQVARRALLLRILVWAPLAGLVLWGFALGASLWLFSDMLWPLLLPLGTLLVLLPVVSLVQMNDFTLGRFVRLFVRACLVVCAYVWLASLRSWPVDLLLWCIALGPLVALVVPPLPETRLPVLYFSRAAFMAAIAHVRGSYRLVSARPLRQRRLVAEYLRERALAVWLRHDVVVWAEREELLPDLFRFSAGALRAVNSGATGTSFPEVVASAHAAHVALGDPQIRPKALRPGALVVHVASGVASYGDLTPEDFRVAWRNAMSSDSIHGVIERISVVSTPRISL